MMLAWIVRQDSGVTYKEQTPILLAQLVQLATGPMQWVPPATPHVLLVLLELGVTP